MAGFLGAREKIWRKFLPVYFPQFVPKHIEKQGVMGRKDGFDSVILSRQKLGQIVADGDGVVFIQRRNRVIKLITAYEAALNGNTRVHSTNGYEERRQNAQAEMGGGKLRAAAAASAIAFVASKLLPGQSTDGAIFFANGGKPVGAGQLTANEAGGIFEFPVEVEARQRP